MEHAELRWGRGRETRATWLRAARRLLQDGARRDQRPDRHPLVGVLERTKLGLQPAHGVMVVPLCFFFPDKIGVLAGVAAGFVLLCMFTLFVLKNYGK